MSQLVAKLAQYGTSTVKYWICPGQNVFVCVSAFRRGIGLGTVCSKMNESCQLRTEAVILVPFGPARLSQASSRQLPKAFSPVKRLRDCSGRTYRAPPVTVSESEKSSSNMPGS